MQLPIARTDEELRTLLSHLRAGGHTLALVPTMGALHAGHRALMQEAKRHADRVLVYIYVNPLQFGPNEDLSRYPRPFKADLQACMEEGVDGLYAPSDADVYPQGFSTTVHAGSASEGMEGALRPGHFDGVATVLAKMFGRIRPDVAVFGEKDYQQLCVVRQLVADLDMGITIIGLPTIRDTLAFSSRNAYLSENAKQTAPALYRTLTQAAQTIQTGTPPAQACKEAKEAILKAGFEAVDYIELRDATTLAPLQTYHPPARLLAAARLEGVRLLDNVPV